MRSRIHVEWPQGREVLAAIVCLAVAVTLPTGSEPRVVRTTPLAGPNAVASSEAPRLTTLAPPADGYFPLLPVGAWSSLPGDDACAREVHRSAWEPRPDNTKRNHVIPDAAAVHASFAVRRVAIAGAADPRWDSWLLPRVDGQFTGTTDEIFQWAACKWGLSDNLLRAVAVRESTWYQYETYPSGQPVTEWGSGDMMPAGTAGASVYCQGIARYGYDYQRDFGPAICPQTFSIVGVKSWQSPSWGAMPDNQNGTLPFSRDSTAFAVDYLASQLRGCYEGWQVWLHNTGTRTYAAGDVWGCVGAWYAGEWHSQAADTYLDAVEHEEANHTWLEPDWPRTAPACDPKMGCPGPDPLRR